MTTMTTIYYYARKIEQMHPADIKASLNKSGCTMRTIADLAGVNESAVSHVIYGRSSSLHVAKIIANEIGLSMENIWPGRYRQDEAA